MSTKYFLITLILFGFLNPGYGQLHTNWEKWNWLIGEWRGEGSGEPGQGEGTFNFKPDLDNKILVRRSHTQFPLSANQQGMIHNDLMIIYPDDSGNPVKAIYFDNEGHTINYSITYNDRSIILTSDKIPKVPIFRLSYQLLPNKMVNTKFEISHDGVQFKTYLEGKSIKTI